jgi:dye decolorizing peroxidase
VTGAPSSRRQFLGLLGAAAAGAAAAAPVTAIAVGQEDGSVDGPSTPMRTLSPYGAHQSGVVEPTQRFVELVALDLLPETDAEALGRLMRLWTGDVVALMAGRPAPGDTAPELAEPNTDLTVTVGWGPGVFELPGLAPTRPPGLHEIPPMRHDRLESRWSGGDLLLVVGAHDGTSVAHAVRRMVADAAPFARMRWRQSGFWNGFGKDGSPATGRNLFGQVDGSANPTPGTRDFDKTVWATDPAWFEGGTTLVVRRIAMDLDHWDTATRSEQEASIGRRLADGAPLTGGGEADDLDLTATDEGRPVVDMRAHARLAHPTMNNGHRIFRKGLSYTHDGPDGTESGLVFLSFQADIARQFTPMQHRLDMHDLLNEWTTAVGSAVFAVLPGFREGGWLGETLLG